MDGIREIRTSFERLLKVWLSKLDFAEEDLVAEDMIWFAEIFDGFFKGNNLKEFINRDGRYQVPIKLDENNFTDFLNSSFEFSSKKIDRWKGLRYTELQPFEYYEQLNFSDSNFYKDYNVFDIYFRVLKKLFSAASENELSRTRGIVLVRVISSIQKVSVFEKEGLNSVALLNDFYYVRMRNILSKKEIQENRPDEEFIKAILYKTVFMVFYLPLLRYQKVPLLRKYLLETWIFLNEIQADNFMEDFLKSLSDMTLSNSIFREIDLYDIRSLLEEKDRNAKFYKFLEEIKNEGDQIINFEDVKDFLKKIKKANETNKPEYISENIIEYFLKIEEDSAIQLYKFRSIQSLVLEYLSLVLHFKDRKFFDKSIYELRRNEQWSNHRKFFPYNMSDVLVWLIIFSDIKREMNFRVIEPSYGYKYLDDILLYLFKDVFFDEISFRNAMKYKNVNLNPSFLNSMAGISKDLLNKIESSSHLFQEEEEKENIRSFIRSLVGIFSKQIEQSESLPSIDLRMFQELITKVFEEYKNRSILYFLSTSLNSIPIIQSKTKEIDTFVILSDLQSRRYLLPDFDTPSSVLSNRYSRQLIEEEFMQFDFSFLEKEILSKKDLLTRESVQGLVKHYSKDSLFIFRNSNPSYWFSNIQANLDESDSTNLLAFSYNTFDRNSELIIIPKTSISIHYLNDERFKDFSFHENTLMIEFLDLGNGNTKNIEYLKTINGFQDRFNLNDGELEKRFWIRIVAKTKILVNDKSSILRFKLNVYGE